MEDFENGLPVNDGAVAETAVEKVAEAALPPKLNQRVECPYCQNTFLLREMEFLQSNGANPFTLMFSEAKNTESDEELTRRNRTSTSVARNGAGAQTAQAGAAEKQVEQVQQYGVPNADDVIAKRFLKDYGEGVNLFRYSRQGTFYKIGTQEQARSDPQYGYVSDEDAWDGDAPQLLHIFERGRDTLISTRLCPHCHCDLPSGYFACDPKKKFTIALAGGTSSGKTQFITFALNCLGEELGMLNLGTARLESYSRWFLQVYMDQIKRKQGTDSTRREFQLLPFLISIAPRGQQRCFVAIHDVPGEYTDPNNNLAVNKRSFKQANLVLMMLDSSYLFKDVANVDKSSQQCDKEPEEALQVFDQYNLCVNCKSIIVVLTKIDTIFNADPPIIHADMDGLKNGMYLYENKLSVHRGAVNRTMLREIDNEICTRVLKDVKPNLREDLALAFDPNRPIPVSFLGVSTLIKGEDGRFQLSPEARGGRHRLIEPLLRAFADLGILPEKEGDIDSVAAPVYSGQPEQTMVNQPVEKPRGGFFGLFGKKKGRG